MPIENERKYILSLDSEEEIKHLCPVYQELEQGYLSNHSRIRVSRNLDGTLKYEFCFKYQTSEGLVEIEKEISNDDFNKLSICVTNVIIKTRYTLLTEDKIWTIDYLKNEEGKVYFVLAEHEMPEGQEAPEFIPDIIQKYLLKIVDKDDVSFTNKRLANESYAVKKLRVITQQREAPVKKKRKKTEKKDEIEL